MAATLVLYTCIHQPLPLRLPAQPIPPGAIRQAHGAPSLSRGAGADDLERCLYDLRAAEEAFREVIAPAYLPALEALRARAEQGLPISIGVSEAFLELARRWSPELLRPLRQLLRAPAVEAVAVEPRGSLLFAFDLPGFMRAMGDACERLAHFAGRAPRAAEVSGFCLNHELYHALARLGFWAIAAGGEAQARGGHHPAHPSRWGGPIVLYRLDWLSDELRFQLRGGCTDPARLAETAAGIPGEAALVHFEFDDLAFGPGAAGGADLLAAMAAACAERGVEPFTLTRAARRFERRAVISPPPTTTGMAGVSIEDLVGDGWTERLIFGRMQQAYQLSRLLGNPALRGVAGWLLQRIHLDLPALCAGRGGLPPSHQRAHWWRENPGYDATTGQILAVYDNFIRATAGHVREEVLA